MVYSTCNSVAIRQYLQKDINDLETSKKVHIPKLNLPSTDNLIIFTL
jgi:hypothetical protein